ncbi:MAG: glutamine-hydrolyzing GMP synthase [Firmicutes bacterium]|nr:glutamine-hydrolyzing GMP synthase [Candidatus Fermentithermobacillaceae bacterium]
MGARTAPAKRSDHVVILDFGGQYTHLIARRVREERVYSTVVCGDISKKKLMSLAPGAVILSGGPGSVYEPGALLPDPGVFEIGVPCLGICYGMQAMAKVLGGEVVPGEQAGGREFGPATLYVAEPDNLFRGLPEEVPVWMSHGDSVAKLPPGFKVMGRTAKTPVAVMGDPARRFYGVQFHPEVKHTPHGNRILRNFLFDVAGLSPSWTMQRFIEGAVEEIRAKVGPWHAVAAVSGGVDSTVSAVLVHRAIGDRLHPIFVDHGLLRKDEAKNTVEALARLGINVHLVDASRRFLEKLRGVRDPEKKRKIIGREFIRVFEEEASRFPEVRYLVQGTIYPDVIESGSKVAAKIKTHHNVGGLPRRMQLELVEPLRMLFKDEVRKVGKELGLPDEMLNRHPFPGPGLAVRVLGEVTREKLDILRHVQSIIDEEVRRAGLYEKLWQCFAVLPGVRTVGVMGDSRTYGELVALRAVESEDAMTADWSRLPYQLLERISSRIVNEVPGVNRVVYDITSKPPATIEWE